MVAGLSSSLRVSMLHLGVGSVQALGVHTSMWGAGPGAALTGRPPLTPPSTCRYMAIVHPFQPRLSALATRGVIAGIWLVALALAFPQCLYSTITQDQGATKCLVAWPEDGGGKTPLL